MPDLKINLAERNDDSYSEPKSGPALVKSSEPIVNNAVNMLEESTRYISAAAKRAKTTVVDSLEVGKNIVIEGMTQADRGLRLAADERPFQVVAVVAGAAFLSGVLLRIWRSRRDA